MGNQKWLYWIKDPKWRVVSAEEYLNFKGKKEIRPDGIHPSKELAIALRLPR